MLSSILAGVTICALILLNGIGGYPLKVEIRVRISLGVPIIYDFERSIEEKYWRDEFAVVEETVLY